MKVIYDPEKGTFDKELEFIELLKENYTRNPKKLTKFIKRVWKDQHEFLQRGIMKNFLILKDPITYLDECIDHAEQYRVLLPQLKEQGFHGIMMHDLDIYPVQIKTNANWLKDGKQWAMDQEEDIMEQWIITYMKENGLDNFVCRITLFQEYGFSGLVKLMDISRVPDDGKE